jgi:hypothetical protein
VVHGSHARGTQHGGRGVEEGRIDQERRRSDTDAFPGVRDERRLCHRFVLVVLCEASARALTQCYVIPTGFINECLRACGATAPTNSRHASKGTASRSSQMCAIEVACSALGA